MPLTKLTLTVEPEIVEMAKRYAREHNTSVSATFARFIRSVAGEGKQREVTIPHGSALNKLAGIISLPSGRTVDEARLQAIQEKHCKPTRRRKRKA